MAERAQPSPQPLDGDPVSRVIVAGASGLAGALAADLVWHHPKLELARASSRSDAGTRICDLHPRHRVPMELTELDVDAATDCDAAIVAYPHGAAAPVVAALRAAGARAVWIAGRKPRTDAGALGWGLDPDRPPRFVHLGCDLLTELEYALGVLGVIAAPKPEAK